MLYKLFSHVETRFPPPPRYSDTKEEVIPLGTHSDLDLGPKRGDRRHPTGRWFRPGFRADYPGARARRFDFWTV